MESDSDGSPSETASRTSVAVLMATYHRDSASLLALAVNSVMDQTYKNIHLFLMVDGSHNPAAEEYLAKLDLERATILRNSSCRGLAGSLNTLIDRAVALGFDYYARMDADDICRLDRIEKQVHYLDVHPDVDVLGSWCHEINQAGDRVGILQKPEQNHALLARMPISSPLIHSSVMIRGRVFGNHRYPTNRHLSEDFALWLQLQREGFVFANLQETLVQYRRDDNFGVRRSEWARITCESKLRLQCLGLPGALTIRNVVGVLVRIGVQCALGIAPRSLASAMLTLQRFLTNGSGRANYRIGSGNGGNGPSPEGRC